MLEILFNSNAIAEKVSADICRHFEHSYVMTVDDFCNYLIREHSGDLLNTWHVTDIQRKYPGMMWNTEYGIVHRFCDNAFLISEPNAALSKTTVSNKKEEKSMYIDITGVNRYNDRVVIVRFSDGSFTKSVCSEKDKFDLDIGISLCVLKKFLSDKSNITYPTLIRKVHKMMELKEKDRKQALADKAERRKLQEERHQRNIARAAKKAKEVYGGMIREAVMDAMKEDDE